ncbi:hypothetical protein IAR55_001863 [Kwoniella newhampshirensis]|uniref:DUF7587 domain-containing protein n=1 Tax=Kwoniella newhampshirensis TaxID=1651941 RepID=A0AAW0Z3D6_9TREE
MVEHDVRQIESAMKAGSMVIRLYDRSSIIRLVNGQFQTEEWEGKSTLERQRELLLWKSNLSRGLMTNLDNHKMMSHISKGWSRDSSDQATRIRSPWISSTQSFEWAVWETTRRLVDNRESTVRTSLIDTSDLRDVIHVKPIPYLMGHVQYPDYARAVRLARWASEVLFYGRIPRHKIVDTLEWTHEFAPLTLPEHFFITSPGEFDPEDWLDNLVWQPGVHKFGETLYFLRRRAGELQREEDEDSGESSDESNGTEEERGV